MNRSNTVITLCAAALGLIGTQAQAGCLDALTTAAAVTSKVRGIYVTATGTSTHHYVILDRTTCTSGAGDATLASGTKSSYYLAFKADDRTMMSALLSAQATGAIVQFRISPAPGAVANGVNEIAYVISPASAAP